MVEGESLKAADTFHLPLIPLGLLAIRSMRPVWLIIYSWISLDADELSLCIGDNFPFLPEDDEIVIYGMETIGL